MKLEDIDENLIWECKGIPDVVINIVEIVYVKFENTKPKNDKLGLLYNIQLDRNDVQKPFFNKLEVLILIGENPDLNPHYSPEYNVWDDANRVYDMVKIRVIVSEDYKSEIKELIGHELLHAYNDYRLKFNTNVGFVDRDKNYYSNNTVELNKIKEKFKNNATLNYLTTFIYYLMKTENKGNVTQLYFELEKRNYTLDDINKGKYKNDTFYSIYRKINKYAGDYMDLLNQNELILLGEFISHTNVKKLYSPNINVFKKNMINYFRIESENVLRKMHKIMIEYLEYHRLAKIRTNLPHTRVGMLEMMRKLGPI